MVPIGLLGAEGSAVPETVAKPASVIKSDIVRQSGEPTKRKEISATIVRSVETELIILKVNFPEDALQVKVSLYNLLGSLVEVNPQTSATKGEVDFRFDTRGLPNGPYIVVLEANQQRITKKIMLTTR